MTVRPWVDLATGAYAPEALQHLLGQEISRAKRYQEFFALMIVRVDSPAGTEVQDATLKLIFETVRPQIRESDLIGRYGYDLAIVACNVTAEDSADVADRLRAEIANYAFPGVLNGRRTVSIGIACFPTHATEARALTEDALLAVGHAQELGGNVISLFRGPAGDPACSSIGPDASSGDGQP